MGMPVRSKNNHQQAAVRYLISPGLAGAIWVATTV